jgi:sec-independent protein translocase protein TatB
MFDFAWSEFALIGVVALIAIGPKDLPVAIKAISGAIKKARKMASEFQTHVDEMVREADLGDVRDQINQLRNFDIKGEIEKAVDADGSLASTFATNPFDPGSYTTPEPAPEIVAPEPEKYPDPESLAAPSFIPPEIAAPPEPPAFVPPGVILRRQT